ncbi:MAG: hypothetical protein AAGD14_17340 [Planctomycetota bacterium]
MTQITVLLLTLALTQAALRSRTRRRASRILRPADEWTGADVRYWLALIEPFPLGRETPVD